jgi:cysteine-S-conjugate beta-lyase
MVEKYDFDKEINRIGSNSLKYDYIQNAFGTKDVIPMWVADMDFATADFILNAIRKRCEHEVLGYSLIPEGWYSAIQNWLKKRHNWEVASQEIGFVPGIVPGIAFAINCFTKPEDKILIQTPVYPPFMNLPLKNGRELVINKLKYDNGQLQIDFEDFEAKASSGCKLFLLCSPHNPGGRIWTKKELLKMSDICKQNDILIVSDEIHGDLALPKQNHFSIGQFPVEERGQIITLMAPSKTFNIPGLGSSFFIIQDQEIRSEFRQFLDRSELSNGNIFAFVAAQAAFENGEEWLRQLTAYLQKNVEYVDEFLKKNIPQIKACIPQASFLIWLDCRDLSLPSDKLQRFFIDNAKLGLSPGDSFGPGGEGFMRLNIGCTKDILRLAMEKLKTAVNNLIY